MRVTVNGCSLYFDVSGPELQAMESGLEPRPQILALHGGPGYDHGYLKAAPRALERLGQVIYLDLRAQGRSDRPPVETCTLEQMADDVSEFISAIGLEKPILFGHSAGGFVALHTAIRHPDSIGRMILADTAATFAPEPDAEPQEALAGEGGAEAMAAFQRLLSGDVSDPAMDAFFRLVVPLLFHPSARHRAGEVFGLISPNLDVARYFWQHLAQRYDVRPQLHLITTPTLVIYGDYEWAFPPSAQRRMGDIPGAKLVEIPAAGHFSFLEQGDAFAEAVQQFLSPVLPA
jgi:proline iminopeptidase